MRLLVTAPESRRTEREYVLGIILREFLGIRFDLVHHDRPCVMLSCPGASGSIEFPDLLLSGSPGLWRRPESLPAEPLLRMPVAGASDSVPVLFGEKEGTGGPRMDGSRLLVPMDLFGGCFFLLTRYEEVVADEKSLDQHSRFPAASSLLHREGLLERPLVDEYTMLLANWIELIWTGSKCARSEYRLILTHDVDHPFSSANAHAALVLRRSVGDLVRRRDPAMMLRRLYSHLRADAHQDPINTFDWLMDQSERVGVSSRFHFMASDRTRYDSGYDIASPFLGSLLDRVASRGHEIGIHPSYRSSVEPERFRAEVEELERAVASATVSDWSRTSRQHYLRWNAASTWGHLDEVGIREDSSVGFADATGFRCGTSREYTTYDWRSEQPLRLRELPLIVMDVTLTGRNYQGLGWEAAMDCAAGLAQTCRHFRTPFTLLWHNDKVITRVEKSQYLELLEAIS